MREDFLWPWFSVFAVSSFGAGGGAGGGFGGSGHGVEMAWWMTSEKKCCGAMN